MAPTTEDEYYSGRISTHQFLIKNILIIHITDERAVEKLHVFSPNHLNMLDIQQMAATELNFGQAMTAIRRGKTVTRDFKKIVFLQPPCIVSFLEINPVIALFKDINMPILKEKHLLTYDGETNKLVPYYPGTDDMLSERWMIVKPVE